MILMVTTQIESHVVKMPELEGKKKEIKSKVKE